MDLEYVLGPYILGPRDVTLRPASVSIHAAWLQHNFEPASFILMLLTICEMETSSKYVPAYHTLSDHARVYEDFLHHDLE